MGKGDALRGMGVAGVARLRQAGEDTIEFTPSFHLTLERIREDSSNPDVQIAGEAARRALGRVHEQLAPEGPEGREKTNSVIDPERTAG